MHFNGLKLSGALEQFSITLQFLAAKMQKNQIFEEIMGFECSFFRFSNGSSGD